MNEDRPLLSHAPDAHRRPYHRTGKEKRKAGAGFLRLRLVLLVVLFLLPIVECERRPDAEKIASQSTSIFNPTHLNHLIEPVVRGDSTLAIVHIYAEAPNYEWVADDDEGAAALDDAARAAVVYLRRFELTGDDSARVRAEQLLRFVLYMQREDGLFYNFVWNDRLDINTEHANSRADTFGWWAARGVWALGMSARVLKNAHPAFARICADRVRRTFPFLDGMLAHYGQYTHARDRTIPAWLVGGASADATSEMLLGLVALNRAFPDNALQTRIDRFAEGIAMMQYGSMNAFPWAAHASYADGWHGWGNSQTMALAEAGHLESAKREAEQFYPRLLVGGWMHSFQFDDPDSVRRYEQIAYAVRGVSVGFIRLFEATGDVRYATLAGLAASWFTGDNVTGAALYDPATGRGYDGINGPDDINKNAGAESTIEALFTILEVENHPEAARWMSARGAEPVHVEKEGKKYYYRVFSVRDVARVHRLGLVMDLTDERLLVLEDSTLDSFLSDV